MNVLGYENLCIASCVKTIILHARKSDNDWKAAKCTNMSHYLCIVLSFQSLSSGGFFILKVRAMKVMDVDELVMFLSPTLSSYNQMFAIKTTHL